MTPAERFRLIIANNLRYRINMSRDFRSVVKQPVLKRSIPYETLEDMWAHMTEEEHQTANEYICQLTNGEVSIEEFARATPYISFEAENNVDFS